MDRDSRRLRSLLPVASVLLMGIAGSIAAATYLERQIAADSEQAFDRDASSATAEIEREIERHVSVVDDTVRFAESTWPGELEEWRHYVAGRVTGGTHLAFSSTAGLIERVPASDVQLVEQREAAASGQPFTITEFTPLPSGADRLVLTRTGEDVTGSVRIRGLELTAAVGLLGLALPETTDGLAVGSVGSAPDLLLDVLGFDRSEIDDNDVVNTNVIFVHAVGKPDEPPLGWVVIPAELGYLLTNAIGDLDGGALNLSISIPDTNIEGDVGRYEGDPSAPLATATRVQETAVDLGGWDWIVTVWAADSYGIGSSRIRSTHAIVGGILITIIVAALVELRRRHKAHLVLAEFEVELQRTLAETDPLTGLLNRQGMKARGVSAEVTSELTSGGAATFFLDLDGFKPINDRLGHAAGDAILVGVARAIRSVARDNDFVGRLGGDEFVVVCPGLTSSESVSGLAERMRAAINQIEDPASVDVSIGVSVNQPGDSFDFAASVKASDAAMYQEKQSAEFTGRGITA